METFAQATSDGNTFAANGIDVVGVWDFGGTDMVPAGVIAPDTAPTVAGSGVGSITGTYYGYVRFVDDRGNLSNLSPISGPAVVTAVGQIDYTNLPVPAVGTVARRQIIRNTNGSIGATDPTTGVAVPPVGYVDIDTADLFSTSLSSTRLDEDLRTQESVDIDSAAVDYGVPPDDKPFIVWHQSRMYFGGAEDYREGSAAVTFGSPTVQGYQTNWKETFVGRFFYTPGANRVYEITAVDTVNQTLTLGENYATATNRWADYAVKSTPTRIKTFQWSQANLPESCNPTDAAALPEDGDYMTGGFNYGSYLYWCESRHLYRWICGENPALDGRLFLACNRGVVNNRCWVIVNETCYLLDTGGVYAYAGDDQGRPLSTPIQDMFNSFPGQGPKINWAASRYFHACHSPNEEVIRWFVALNGDYTPRHAIVYAYKVDKWVTESFPFRVSASVSGRIGGIAGTSQQPSEQYFVGSTGGRVVAPLGGNLDGQGTGGTVQGTVTGAGPLSLEDVQAVFADGCVNSPVAIAEGRGRGQVRYVTAVENGNRLVLNTPWQVIPDETSVYVVGGIRYTFSSQRIRWQVGDVSQNRGVELEFEPLTVPTTIRVGLAPDFSDTVLMAWDVDRGFRVGVKAGKDERGQDVDLTQPSGYQLLRADSYRESSTTGAMGRTTRLVMSGVGGAEEVRIGTVLINGATG